MDVARISTESAFVTHLNFKEEVIEGFVKGTFIIERKIMFYANYKKDLYRLDEGWYFDRW